MHLCKNLNNLFFCFLFLFHRNIWPTKCELMNFTIGYVMDIELLNCIVLEVNKGTLL